MYEVTLHIFLHFKLEHILWGGPYEAGLFHSSL